MRHDRHEQHGPHGGVPEPNEQIRGRKKIKQWLDLPIYRISYRRSGREGIVINLFPLREQKEVSCALSAAATAAHTLYPPGVELTETHVSEEPFSSFPNNMLYCIEGKVEQR